jgi:NAD(P) transhydrogenase
MVPSIAEKLTKSGYQIQVEAGAGIKSGFLDKQYEAVGCKVVPRQDAIKNAELVFSVNPPATFEGLKDKMLITWIARMLPDGKELIKKANAEGVTLVDPTAAPRITIAQKLDVLSSQAKCAGHRAVVEATYQFQKFHSAEMTAAGKYPPSNTFVLGCGVAGLASLGTSKALGSQVRSWDVRDVSDQVQSMGATWVKVDFKEDGAGAGGYAKESSAEFQAAQKETFHKHAKECDIIITTAAIPGRKSPILIEDYMVKDMKPGSVVVDLAAAGGGNCAMTKAGEVVLTDNGVAIVGYTDLASRMGSQASNMWANNMMNLVNHIAPKGAADFMPNVNAALAAADGDIIWRSIVCCKGGQEIAMPPPPEPTPVKPKAPVVEKKVVVADPNKDAMVLAGSITAASASLMAMGTGVPVGLLNSAVLAGAAGYQVVYGVAHALHTPLMSVTNAISGMTAIGGMLVLGKAGGFSDFLASIATSISMVNIVGGFIVSKRMLDLFKRPGDVDYSNYLAAPGVLVIAAPLMSKSLIEPTQTVSSLMCIGAIGGLASMKTKDYGAKLGMCGVAGGMTTTLLQMDPSYHAMAGGLLGVGTVGGIAVGTKVEPMALPQTVAAFHSLVGAAAMVTSIASYGAHPGGGMTMHNMASILGDFIGGVTLTGSLVAFGKLNGNLGSAPLNLPNKNMLNLGGLAGQGLLMTWLFNGGGNLPLWGTAGLSSAMGYHLVASVGGADMPVCITVLNSYSGWALVAEGFLLDSPMLTIVGSLIGFSGGILTKIMCDAMNRDIANVLFGGINVAPPKPEDKDAPPKVHVETSADSAAASLGSAKSVLIVPGYGMAVARAQMAVADIARTLRAADIECRFGIHPVAGRMPGQMNVLLAEAGVPYDWVEEMDEVNPGIADVDVTLVVGANDITNSAAQEVEGCSIWGMPVIEVWKGKKTIFMKRTMGAGYADLDNLVFYKENTEMLLGDAKDMTEKIAAKLKADLA